jgi:hypothetical protein
MGRRDVVRIHESGDLAEAPVLRTLSRKKE